MFARIFHGFACDHPRSFSLLHLTPALTLLSNHPTPTPQVYAPISVATSEETIQPNAPHEVDFMKQACSWKLWIVAVE